MFDISENGTMWKLSYFSLPKITKSTVINYEAAKHLYWQWGNGSEAGWYKSFIEILCTQFPNSTKIPTIFHAV